jgi:hypothetical protein
MQFQFVTLLSTIRLHHHGIKHFLNTKNRPTSGVFFHLQMTLYYVFFLFDDHPDSSNVSRSNSVFGSGDDSVNGNGEIPRGKHCVLPDDFLQVSHVAAAHKKSSYLFFSCLKCFLVVRSHFSVSVLNKKSVV